MDDTGGAICVYMVCLLVVSAIDTWIRRRPP